MVVLHEKAKEKHKYLPIRERYVKCSIYTRCVIIHKSKAINSISINELGSISRMSFCFFLSMLYFSFVHGIPSTDNSILSQT